MQNNSRVKVGAGVLTWDARERRTDRYGSVYVMADDRDSFSTAPCPSLIEPGTVDLEGRVGRLIAVVTATRESTHIGDLFRRVAPRTPDLGAEIALGEGRLFTIGVQDGGLAVGLAPDDGRQSDWLDIRALYDAHEQSVELWFEPAASEPARAEPMEYVLRAIGFANGMPCPHAGQYVLSFDFDAAGGVGYGEFTADLDRAMKFADGAAAGEFWRTVSKVRPFRPDGEPNRPLTALSVQITPVERERARSLL